nr:hypothetical protein GCM10020093_073630 [Planobispora longispora]
MPVQPPPPRISTERRDTWRPTPDIDLTDGESLHRLLYTDGDLAHPRSWSSGATGIVVRDTLRAIEARIESVRPGETVRVLDYGAGTGLASIELIKACVSHGVEQRLADRGPPSSCTSSTSPPPGSPRATSCWARTRGPASTRSAWTAPSAR